MVLTIVAVEMSVRNPSRPWLTPTSGTSCGAIARAMLSIVPSPPMTIARSARLAQLVEREHRILPVLMWDAVSSSSMTSISRPSRKRAELEQRYGDFRGSGTCR